MNTVHVTYASADVVSVMAILNGHTFLTFETNAKVKASGPVRKQTQVVARINVETGALQNSKSQKLCLHAGNPTNTVDGHVDILPVSCMEHEMERAGAIQVYHALADLDLLQLCKPDRVTKIVLCKCEVVTGA